MSAVDSIMDVLTFGGHSQLEAVRRTYEDAYRRYDARHHFLCGKKAQIDTDLKKFGTMVMASFKMLAKAVRLVEDFDDEPRSAAHAIAPLPVSSSSDIGKVERLVDNYSTAFAAAGGAGAGSALAVGSWSLVALAGTASTGTAIGTLGGVAAYNATLAWFGGGALAAGGAGMAGGTLVLGGVVIAPIIAVAAWHSRSKAKKIAAETELVEQEERRLIGMTQEAQAAHGILLEQMAKVAPLAEHLAASYHECRRAFYPIPLFSRLKRKILKAFRPSAHSGEEVMSLLRLGQAMTAFASHFENAASA